MILFLVNGFVTVLTSKEQDVFVAGGDASQTAVFSPGDRDRMQVYVQDSVGSF